MGTYIKQSEMEQVDVHMMNFEKLKMHEIWIKSWSELDKSMLNHGI